MSSSGGCGTCVRIHRRYILRVVNILMVLNGLRLCKWEAKR